MAIVDQDQLVKKSCVLHYLLCQNTCTSDKRKPWGQNYLGLVQEINSLPYGKIFVFPINKITDKNSNVFQMKVLTLSFNSKKTFWEKEKMLASSIFSFSQNVLKKTRDCVIEG